MFKEGSRVVVVESDIMENNALKGCAGIIVNDSYGRGYVDVGFDPDVVGRLIKNGTIEKFRGREYITTGYLFEQHELKGGDKRSSMCSDLLSIK